MSTIALDTCNAALLKVGAQPLASLSGTGGLAVACASAYPRLRLSELRKYEWKFSIRQVSIVEDAVVPIFGRDHCYILPTDFVRMANPLPEDDTDTRDWVLRGRRIHTDDLSPLNAWIVSGLPDAVITGITKANPAVVTIGAGHSFTNGDLVRITGVVGMTQVNDLDFVVANTTSTTFQLSGINSTGYGTYTSGGLVENGNPPFLFREILATLVAFEITELVNQSNTKRQLLGQAYASLMTDAKKADLYDDAFENVPTTVTEWDDAWETARE